MLYEKYEAKIEKRAKRIQNIKKHRKYIYITLSVIILILLFFMITKGIVSKPALSSLDVHYCDDIEIDGGAFMSSVTYQYREKNGQWTNIKPTIPGKYEARTISKGFFGNKRYSDPVEFEIKKREVDVVIKEDEFVYGETPQYEVSNLDDNHRISLSSLKYEYKEGNLASVSYDTADAKITDTEGNDVTSYYQINSIAKDVNLLARNLEVVIDDASKEYDGEPISTSKYQITSGSLYGNDELEITYSGSQTEVGSSSIKAYSVKVLNDNADISSLYNIKVDEGKLSVFKRNIKIKTGGIIVSFDGKEHGIDSLSIESGSLLPGDRISVVRTPKFVGVGTYKNELDYVIVNSKNQDVTKNYNIAKELGTIIIEKAIGHIKGSELTTVYTGEPVLPNFVDVNHVIPDNAEVTPILDKDYIDVGVYDYKITGLIVKINGIDYSDSFNLTFEGSKITILSREIQIKAKDVSKEYDTLSASSQEVEFLENTSLCAGDKISFTSDELLNIGRINNKISDVKILNEASKDVTKNYSIIISDSYLEITKRKIEIYPEEISVEYDGTKKTSNEITGNNLIFGHKIIGNCTGGGASCDDYDNTISDYKVLDSKEVDVSLFYDVSVKTSMIHVLPRKITIIPKYVEVEYDGIIHSSNEIEIKEGSLVGDDSISVSTSSDALNVGENTNKISSCLITNSKGDVSKNYDVTLLDGVINILKRNIKICPESISKQYDGTLLCASNNIVADNLLAGHFIEGKCSGEILYFGDGEATIDSYKILAGEVDVTACYNVEVFPSKLSILKANLTIKAPTSSKIYDTNPLLASNEATIISGKLYGSDKLTVKTSGSITDCGSEQSVIEEYKITDADVDVTSSYEVLLLPGKLEVFSCDLIIKPKDATKAYDGTPLYSNEAEIIDSEVELAGVSISIETSGAPVYVTDNIVNKITSYKVLHNEEDVTKNYNIVSQDGSLTITKRTLNIKFDDTSREYDGTKTVLNSYNATGLVDGDRIDITSEISSILANRYEISPTILVFNNQSDITSSYDVSFNKFYFTICKRNITLKPTDFEETYDGTIKKSKEFEIIKGTFVDSDTATVETDAQAIYPCEIKNNIVSYQICRDEADITDSYNVTLEPGAFNILKRKIVIAPKPIDTVYDASIHRPKEYEILGEYDFIPEQHYTIIYDGFLAIPGHVETTISDIYVSPDIDMSEDISYAYDFVFEKSYINISKRDIVVKANDASKEYDGTALTPSGYELLSGKILGIHHAEVSYEQITYPWESTTQSVPEIKIYNRSNVEVTSYYNITKEKSSLTISKKALSISLNNQELVYNGLDQQASDYNAVGLAQTDVLKFSTNTIKNVGHIDANITSIEIKNGDVLVNECYNITTSGAVLEVIPRSINLAPKSLTVAYDGKPHTQTEFEAIVDDSHYSLLDIHNITLNINIYKDGLICEAINVGTYDLIIDESSISIKDNDIDVINNYDISYSGSTLNIIQGIIYITTDGQTLDYDGEEHYLNTYQITGGQVVEGDRLEVDSYSTFKNEGTYDNDLTFKVYDSHGNVSSSYEIIVTYQKIIINRRKAIINSSSLNVEYDGEEHYKYDDVSVSNLVSTHTIEIIDYVSAKNAKDHLNVITIKIKDGSGLDVTSNYDLTSQDGFGTISISKRPITLKTPSVSHEYDGQEHHNLSYEMVGTLGVNDTISLDSSYKPSIKYCSSNDSKNDLKFLITDKDSNDVIENYQITYEYGTFNLTPIDLTIKTGSTELNYSGIKLSCEYFGYDGNYPLGADGPTITSKTEVIYAGTYENVLELRFVNTANVDVTDCYNITYVYGTIKIYPREILIKPNDYEKVYDGKYHQVTEYTSLGNDLISGDVLSIETSVNEKNVIDCSNTIKSYTVVNKAGDDISTSYELVSEAASFKILPLAVEIKAKDVTKEYDGSILESTEFTYLTANQFVESNVTIDTKYKIKYVAESTTDNEITSVVVMDDSGNDVTGNYSITTQKSSISITSRKLDVGPENVSKVYDGTPLIVEHLCYYNNTSLAPTDHPVFKCLYESIYTYQSHPVNEITEIAIYNAEEEDVTLNYTINKEFKGQITINQKPIILKPKAIRVEYDGLVHKATEVDTSQLVEGDYLEDSSLVISGSAKYASDDSTILIENYKILNQKNTDVTNCYKVELLSSNIEIIPKQVKIITGSATKEYDGTALVCKEYECDLSQAVSNDKFIIECIGRQTRVGESENKFRFRAINQVSDDVTSSYDISSSVLGTLTVTKGEEYKDYISLTSSSDGVVYLRQRSLGVYNGSTKMGRSLDYVGDVNPLTYLARAYEALDFAKSRVKLEYGSSTGLIPQYSYDNILSTHNDVSPTIYGDSFEFDTYLYNYLDFTSLKLPDTYVQSESKYYEFVLNNYLQIPQDTKKVLLDIANINHISGSIVDIISKVSALVRNKIPYKLEYDAEFDNTTDAAIYFFTEAQSGICVHYAMAATMMLRALGIPARYVSGYKADVTAGQTYLINPAVGHAWVEVYIEGLGWINLEVTPDDNQNTDDEIIISPMLQSKIYDGTPLTCPTYAVVAFNLPSGYSIEVEAVEGEITEVGIATSIIRGLKIYNSSNRDVTNDVAYSLRTGKLIVNKIPLVVQTGSASKEYDGTPLTNQDAHLASGDILPGHTLKSVEAIGSITNYKEGGQNNDATVVIVDSDGIDVTQRYYDITVNYGKLVILKREVDVYTSSAVKSYDGTPLVSEEMNVTGILEGQRAEYHTTGTITELGTTDNTYEIEILDENDLTVTSSYSFVEHLGTLTVREYDYYLKTKSASKEYDGTPLVCNELEEDPVFPDGFTYSLTYLSSITCFGEIDNEATITVYDVNGEDVTNSLKLSLTFGKLSITKRNITIESKSKAVEYNGDFQTYEGYEIKSGSLAPGEKIDLFFEPHEEIGQHENRFIVMDIMNNNQDVIESYNISYSYGIHEITKVALSITTPSLSKEYDGTPLRSTTYELSGNVVSGHKLSVELYGEITNPGSIVDSYSISLSTADNKEFSDYYEVTSADLGTLTIKRANIKIVSSSASKEYDGTPLTSSGYDLSGSTNLNHTYNIKTIGTITYPISNTNFVYNTVTVQILEGQTDVTTYYNINYEYGKLEIIKRKITLESDSAQKNYDGTALTKNSGSIVEGSLASGDSIYYNCTGQQLEDGTSKNYFDPIITSSDGVNLMYAYEVTLVYGTLTVKDIRSRLVINTLPYRHEYTGEHINIPSSLAYTSDATPLPEGYTMNIGLSSSGIMVGTYSINIESIQILNESGIDITKTEFKIEQELQGTLTIEKANITVESGSLYVSYDGEYHQNNSYQVIEGDVASKDRISATFSSSIIDVGTKENIFVVTILDESGNDITNICYNVKYSYGTLEVVKE